MSTSDNTMPGGQPSITQPMAGPWDSPKVVTVKSVPKVLPDMIVGYKRNKVVILPVLRKQLVLEKALPQDKSMCNIPFQKQVSKLEQPISEKAP